MSDSDTFGKRMQRARLDQDRTIESIARATDWTAVYISEIERGTRRAPADYLKIRRWAKALDLDPDAMAGMARMERDPYTFALEQIVRDLAGDDDCMALRKRARALLQERGGQ